MVHPTREGLGDEAKGESSDRFDRPQESESSDESAEIDGSEPSGDSVDVRSSGGISGALPGRIRVVLRDGADANLLLGREEVENGILQWLRALDLQLIGGCRADERLKPLLKLNASSGAAEDQFMAQLVQHFEAAEVAVLARCLCLPLVSVRVGRIDKRGSMLCPTASRGFLSLTLLPSSHMRLSFTGDDGCIERLALVSNELESSSVIIEDISADTSGRSFLLKFPDSRILYFWCSEKLKAGGMELLVKMKDLLIRKLSLTYLTGISKSRLNSFATHLRGYILASSSTQTATSTSSSGLPMATSDFHSSSEADLCCQSRSSHAQIPASHVAKAHPVYQSSLSPRSNAFKDGTLRNSSTTIGVREKVRRRAGESSVNIQPSTAPASSLPDQSTSQNEGGNVENHGSHGLVLPGLSSLSSPLFSLSPTFTIPSQMSNQSSFFSPYYCWCPPFPTSLQYNTTSHLPSASEMLPLPPLSTLLSSAAPPESLITSKYPLNVAEFPPLKLPSLLPDPLVHLSMPIPSLCPLPSSQQIATFTPFMSDPIVHIPVIDFCSSGQGYLVSAGPSISAAIPPLPISRASHQLLPASESPVEKNARETLRMLMASTPTFTPPKLFNVLPEVLSSMELCGNGISVPGNGPFEGAVDEVESISSGGSSVELSSSAGDANNEVFSEEMEECNSPKIKNCRMFNHEPDEI